MKFYVENIMQEQEEIQFGCLVDEDGTSSIVEKDVKVETIQVDQNDNPVIDELNVQVEENPQSISISHVLSPENDLSLVIQVYTDAERRANHNTLERKRRDQIKEFFEILRDVIPSTQKRKVSRAHILRKASEYIHFIRRRHNINKSIIERLKTQNHKLENRLRLLEEGKEDIAVKEDIQESISVIDVLKQEDLEILYNAAIGND